MPYDAHGDRVEAREVLDDEEYADYRQSLRTKPRSRMFVSENTEEKALASYERLVHGGRDR